MKRWMALALLALTVMAGGGQGPNDNASGPPAADTPPPKVENFDVTFNVYSNSSFTSLLWNLSVNSVWCKTTAGYNAREPDMPPARTWRFMIEDRGFLVEQPGNWNWSEDYADIDVAVTYSPDLSTPTFIKIIQAQDAPHSYSYDMLINGKVVIHHIKRQRGKVFEVKSLLAAEKPVSDW
jgi:hypothetical protein